MKTSHKICHTSVGVKQTYVKYNDFYHIIIEIVNHNIELTGKVPLPCLIVKNVLMFSIDIVRNGFLF